MNTQQSKEFLLNATNIVWSHLALVAATKTKAADIAKDLLTNQEYDSDFGNTLTAYNYIASNIDDSAYTASQIISLATALIKVLNPVIEENKSGLYMVSAATVNEYAIYYINAFTVKASSPENAIKKARKVIKCICENKTTGLNPTGNIMVTKCDKIHRDFPLVTIGYGDTINGYLKINNLTNGGYYVNKIDYNLVTLLINLPSLI